MCRSVGCVVDRRVGEKDGAMFPERAWDAVSGLACPKVDVDIDGIGGIRSFHKFGCAMSQCTHCPKWNTFILKDELECNCNDPI